MTHGDIPSGDLDSLWPEAPAANFLGLQTRTMQSYRQNRRGPVFVRISSRCVRYRKRDLIAWVESRLCTSTSDSGKAEGNLQ